MPNETNDPLATARGGRFRPAHTLVLRAFLVAVMALVGTVALVAFQYYHSPYWTQVGFAPKQPVLFSHRHHAGELRLDCRLCHTKAETSAEAGLPATQTCLNCHSQLFAETVLLQPVVRSGATGRELPWTRVTRLPDHVFFNHAAHISRGVSCRVCHGDVDRMALTAKARSLDMRWCVDCHRDPAAQLPAPEAARLASTQLAVADATASGAGQIRGPPHLTNCSTCHH